MAVLTPNCSEVTKNHLYSGRNQSSLKWILKPSWSCAGSWSVSQGLDSMILELFPTLVILFVTVASRDSQLCGPHGTPGNENFLGRGNGWAIPMSRRGMSLCSALLWGRWSSTCRTSDWGTLCAPLEKGISPFLGQDRTGKVNWDSVLSLCGKTACWMPAVITSYRTTLPFPFFFFLRSRRRWCWERVGSSASTK